MPSHANGLRLFCTASASGPVSPLQIEKALLCCSAHVLGSSFNGREPPKRVECLERLEGLCVQLRPGVEALVPIRKRIGPRRAKKLKAVEWRAANLHYKEKVKGARIPRAE